MRNLLLIIGLIVISIAGVIFILSSNNKRLANQTSSASQANVGVVETGELAPDFRLTDINGRSIGLADFKGKPVIIWFTASYCVPCQIGAKEVSKLDNDLGGNKFNVLMVFVDPQETKNALQAWQERFGNKDWFIAFANSATVNNYQVRFLDTQYLLDKDGVIHNVASTGVGYEGYKQKIAGLK